jgi:4-hydroxybenzoate polyprenyltransferase
MKKPVLFDLTAIARLVRLENLCIIGLTQVAVRICLIGPSAHWYNQLTDANFITLVLSTAMIAAAGYIINDYYDVKIDTVNKPQRVVLGKVLKRRVAIWGHLILNIGALVMGFMISTPVGVIHFLSGFLLWAYSNQLKRTVLWGNFAIASLTGVALLVVNVAFPGNAGLVIAYALFAFFITLAREIIKDIEDRKGDKRFGCRTLPIVYGIRKSKQVIMVFLASLSISMTVFLLYAKAYHLLWLLAVLFMALVLLTQRLYKADSTQQFAQLSKLCKWIMLLGVLSIPLV